MSEYDHEPIRGLPGDLPAGESILWQGSPDWRTFARSALHTRWVSGYFAVLALFGLASGKLFGAGAAVVGGAITQGLLAVFAIAVAKTTVYTITNRRVVLRIGVALNKCVNLPLAMIGSADLRPQGSGHGDIALTLTGRHRLGFAMLWPHARPWRLGQPSPMLRALPDAEAVAKVLAKACSAVVPNEAAAVRSKAVPVRDHGLQGAAA
ncbi:photosynthetic complex putative assembly protein PuhB [Novosphingobium sp. CCH12-A3]|uniref:photosynthetic complex putative assembly protein PuhB n=1 Tax=Novosphingobium sp. CCH12-A3 TaxID=1768752 RepID=UPI00078306E1|nr:photosynthetic complex putative assembly protein PuhB [Novosphingobium sp. CCH12-A3]